MSDERPRLLDFWKWAYSDVLANTVRGVVAEYLVARALGCTGQPRREWDACDIRHPDGWLVEVKATSRIQSWPQARPSTLVFQIGRRRGWDAATNTSAATAGRTAHVYVFGVFEPEEGAAPDPLDPSQWYFLVCPTPSLEAWFGSQKTVRLGRLESKGLARLRHGELRDAVKHAAQTAANGRDPGSPDGKE